MSITPIDHNQLRAFLDRARMSGAPKASDQYRVFLSELVLSPPRPGFEHLQVGVDQILRCFDTNERLIVDSYQLNRAAKIFVDGYRRARVMDPDNAARTRDCLAALFPALTQTGFWQAAFAGNATAGDALFIPNPRPSGLILL